MPTKKPAPIPDTLRPLDMIATDVWRDFGPSSAYYAAAPYVAAMRGMRTMEDRYYEDCAQTVLVYLKSNLSQWRGETARTVKAEIDAHLALAKAGKRLDVESSASRQHYIDTGEYLVADRKA